MKGSRGGGAALPVILPGACREWLPRMHRRCATWCREPLAGVRHRVPPWPYCGPGHVAGTADRLRQGITPRWRASRAAGRPAGQQPAGAWAARLMPTRPTSRPFHAVVQRARPAAGEPGGHARPSWSGPEMEQQAQVRHVSRMFLAAAHFRVPFLSVVAAQGLRLGRHGHDCRRLSLTPVHRGLAFG